MKNTLAGLAVLSLLTFVIPTLNQEVGALAYETTLASAHLAMETPGTTPLATGAPAPSPYWGTETTLSASLVDAKSDRAGIWDVFACGKNSSGSNAYDWHFQANLNTPSARTISYIVIKHNAGGEGWATSKDTQTLGKLLYPIVVYSGEKKQNSGYDQKIDVGAGSNILDLYTQMESTSFSGGMLTIYFTDNKSSVSAKIPASSLRHPATPSTGCGTIQAPSITSISPNSGKAGEQITLIGQLAGVNAVQLNPAPTGGYHNISPVSSDGTRLTFTIPSTFAAYSGTVSVTASNASGKSNAVNLSITPITYIKVTYPNGGESITPGSTQKITWDSNGVETVYLKLRKGLDTYRGPEAVIAPKMTNTGSFDWKVPTTLPAGNDYSVQILDGGGVFGDDSDAYFTISSSTASLTKVISPNGGETLNPASEIIITFKPLPGARHYINLTNVATGFTVSLDSLISDRGVIGQNVESQSMAITMPVIFQNILGEGPSFEMDVCLPDVDRGDGFMFCDKSDAYFALSTKIVPAITINSPTGGEEINKNEKLPITWGQNYLPPGKVTIAIYGLRDKVYSATVEASEGKQTFEIPAGTLSNVPDGDFYRLEICDPNTQDPQQEPEKPLCRYSLPFTLKTHFIPTELSLTAVGKLNNADEAGQWGVFGPGGGNVNKNPADWNIEAKLSLPNDREIKSIVLEHNVSGEVWSTIKRTYYPLVVYLGGTKLNNEYKTSFGRFEEGFHTFNLYGQRESTPFKGGRLIITLGNGQQVKATVAPFTSPEAPKGINVEMVSTEADIDEDEKRGAFQISFDVTALDEDYYIYKGAHTAHSQTAGVIYNIYKNGVIADMSNSSIADVLTAEGFEGGDTNDYYLVEEGVTRTFTLDVSVDPSQSAFYSVGLEAVKYDATEDNSSDDDLKVEVKGDPSFKTDSLQIDA